MNLDKAARPAKSRQPVPVREFMRQLRRPGQLKIGTRLTLCFAAIVLLMGTSEIVTFWQFTLIRGQADRVNQVDQKSLAILRVHANLLMFQGKLAELVTTQDARRFTEEAGSLRRQFLEDVARADQALNVSPFSVRQDPEMLSTLETIQSTLTAQIDALTELASASDWPAVRLRLSNQVGPLNSLTSALVEKVDLEVAENRAQALANIQQVQKRVFLLLPATALFTLLVAGMLGVMVTRSITRPLSQLDIGAQALAQGNFQYQVSVAGGDELAALAGAFNDAACRLRDLYGELTSSEQRFRTLVETAQVGIAVLDENLAIVMCNPALFSLFGSTETRLLGSRTDDPGFKVLREDGSSCPFEERPSSRVIATKQEVRDVALQIYRPASDDWVWVLCNARPIFRSDGSVFQVITTLTDLTEQKRSEAALRRSEAEFRIIFENAAIGMVLVDPSGLPIRTNRALQTMLGYSEEELVKLSFVDVTHPEDVTLDLSLYQDVLDGKLDRYQVKKRYLRKDGETRWARLTLSAFRAAEGLLQYSVAMVEDITAQELAEQSLHHMSTRMLRIQEEEQRRIAREVHDSTSQEMTALTLNLGALRILEHELPPQARKQIAESLALAKRVAREIRTFSYLLHPPMLNELGLWAALRLFIEEFRERSGLRVSLQISSELEVAKLDPAQEMVLFRFVQEALANIHRHSGSKTASVELHLEDRAIKVSVADTGRGIPPSVLSEIHAPGSGGGGVGIPGMQERIGNVGGRVEIQSHPKGTTVTATVPAQYAPPPAQGGLDQDFARKAGAAAHAASRKSG